MGYPEVARSERRMHDDPHEIRVRWPSAECVHPSRGEGDGGIVGWAGQGHRMDSGPWFDCGSKMVWMTFAALGVFERFCGAISSVSKQGVRGSMRVGNLALFRGLHRLKKGESRPYDEINDKQRFD